MSLKTFKPGQRWISSAEPNLGLGLVLEASGRQIRLLFPAADEERAYALSSAPLNRLLYELGDEIRCAEGWNAIVTAIDDHDGLLVYRCKRLDNDAVVELPETRLAHDLQLDSPRDRLLNQQFDKSQAFELRHDSLKHRAKLEESPLRGLLGARIAPVPHQLYIAHEVAHRHAPRVLLADEVGLGKTIEAGLILHHQLLTERAQRVLIIVPPALISQWMLELMRRFNLDVALFDEDRCAAAEAATLSNPFESEQIVLCSLRFLLDNPNRVEQAHEAGWDVLVVDEAHHLRWSETAAEISTEYKIVEMLAQSVPGLILLTATPEQLGQASHFARLRLLDPERYSNLDLFIEEQSHYAEAAGKVEQLLESGDHEAVDALIDRHGTGRVLFRNTRVHVKGFAERKAHPQPLPNPYAQWELFPEDSNDETWVEQDPRVEWLLNWLKSKREKALIICSHKETAIALESYLQFSKGIRCAAFHEGLGVLARDRAAAWFASDDGAQALICSEIGGEGRNFQFAQHLILFDLPTDPDQLEQRIGRLDRIGQLGTVNIHIPYLSDSPQELLYRWYHHGLGAFEKFNHAGSALREEFANALESRLQESPVESDAELIAATQARSAELQLEMEHGRDRLLELSSCREAQANKLQQELEATNNDPELTSYLDQLCNGFDIDVEVGSENSLILRPGTNQEEGFRDISEDGTSITTDRDTALTNEDLKFLSWEHPLITEAFDRVLSGHRGNTALGVTQIPGIPAGTLLLECLFVVHSVAPRSLQLGRYLPPQLFRVLIDTDGHCHESKANFEGLRGQVKDLPRHRFGPALQARRDTLITMLDAADTRAQEQLGQLRAHSLEKIRTELEPELERLRYLQTVNPNVRLDEIQALEAKITAVQSAVTDAKTLLSGVRVLVVN